MTNIRKQYIALIIAVFTFFSLCACGQIKEESAGNEKENNKREKIELTVEQKEKMMSEYQFALQQISFEHVYPNGNDCGFDNSFGYIEDNMFAIQDIDGDGIEELIVSFTTSYMAGMLETVYKYDVSTDTLKEIFAAFPLISYYDCDVITADWSHGIGYEDEDHWPYSIYILNRDTGNYELKYMVEVWVKSVVEQIHPNKFPKDLDDICYLIRNEDGIVEKAMGSEEYGKWRTQLIPDESQIKINYISLSEQNIKAVCD